jgi:shikimate dehydrogenase
MTAPPDLLLGLIGDNIAQSRAPLLHRLAGMQTGLAVRYDLLVPAELGRDFDAVFDGCVAAGYRGINVTYPYKERVTARVTVSDPLVRAMGAVNTVLFGTAGPHGFNTDHTGFIAAYRAARGDEAAGRGLPDRRGRGGPGDRLRPRGAGRVRDPAGGPRCGQVRALARDLAAVAGRTRIVEAPAPRRGRRRRPGS